jgi:vacuolar-type H+-ATPase subunit I/STV1
LKLSTKRIEALVWVLIYAGLVTVCLGLLFSPRPGPWGELLMVVGAIVAAAGAVLIYLRSRMGP